MAVGQEKVSSAEAAMLSAKVAELEGTLRQVQDSVLSMLSKEDEWTDSFYPSQLDIPGGDGGGEAYYV